MRRSSGLAALAVAALGGVALGQGAPGLLPLPVDRFELSGAVAGRVCDDVDRDGVCGPAEPGLAGVRVVLETGQYAITDRWGRYHLAAVSARAPDGGGGGRLLPGRHRLALDGRVLPPGSVVQPARATIEIPMGGLWVQDFAVGSGQPAARTLQPLRAGAPSGRIEVGEVHFGLTGQAAPGDSIRVAGQPVQVDPSGKYQAWVRLKLGTNEVPIIAAAPGGDTRFFVQRVEVVQRADGFLVVPGAIEPLARVRSPAGKDEKASTGWSMLRLEAPPGTRIGRPGGEVEVGPGGFAELPVDLKPGDNEVALTVERPGQPRRGVVLRIAAAPRPLVIGLLDLEGTFNLRSGTLELFGRGAMHAENRLGEWELSLDLDLRDQDVVAARNGQALALLLPRSPERLERGLDPDRFPAEWADRSVGVVPNAAEGRLRLEARSDRLGRLGFGTHRARMESTEVGRFQRELFGPYVALRAPVGPVTLGVDGYFAPGTGDPLRGLATVPAHDELWATGGSVYYLGSAAVAEGSEVVRVEVRDGLSGLPLAERHLVRGRDYEIDYAAGRILLARPLSFALGLPLLRSESPAGSPEQVLVVDYERLALSQGDRQVAGGQVALELGEARLAFGGVREQGGARGRYQLLRGQGTIPLGPALLLVEAAQSQGGAVAAEDFGLSDDGGLSFSRPPERALEGGQALGVRLRSPGLFLRGHVDAAFRWRSAGFSDRSHDDRALLRQLSLRVDQPLGALRLALLADSRVGADPRIPFEGRSIAARTLGAAVGYGGDGWEARLEVKDAQLTAGADPLVDEPLTGGRTSAGVHLRYRLLSPLELSIGHRQVLAVRGEGPGAVDDTFSTVGADWQVANRGVIGLRAGYGPRTGPLAWLEGEYRGGEGTAYYGTYSVDVDGPDFGEGRAVVGARTLVEGGGAVFVEDVAAHDATAIRLARAVGFSQELASSLHVSARYERGVRYPLDRPAPLFRDAGGLTASWISEWLRLYGRAEVRFERGTAVRGPALAVDRLQRLASAGVEMDLGRELGFSGRVSFSDTAQGGWIESRFLEAAATLAYRARPGMVVLRYGAVRELPPPSRGGLGGERTLQTVSLMPALRLGSRFTLAAGGHAGWSSEAGSSGLVLSGSLRPSFRVVGGLEVAAEVARRSAAPDGEALTALRGELGYRLDDRFLVAVGYTAFGFSGLGLSAGGADSQDRLYLRAELAY